MPNYEPKFPLGIIYTVKALSLFPEF